MASGAFRTAALAALLAAVALTATGEIDRRLRAPEAPAAGGEYIVHWPEGSASSLAGLDGVTVLETPTSDELAKLGAFVVVVEDAAALDAIMAAGAEYVEPNATFTTQGAGNGPVGAFPLEADPLLGQQWQHATTGTRAAWGASTGAGVRVAVVDSGVGPHVDLAVVAGKDFTGGDGQYADHHGHGTHVAGICCARAENGQGGAGVAPGADVLAARVLGSDGSGSLDAIAAGIVWAADNGARVINLSLGGPSGTLSLREALTYAAGRGALAVCAAGNDGSSRPFYPAAFDDCLSVSASTRTDTAASFTNRHASVDIAAPGVDILSSCRGGAYCMMSGTSMAAPVVSGVAALILAASPMSPAALSWRLRSTAAARPALPGGRRVDAAAALAAQPSATPARPPTLAPRPTSAASPRPVPTGAATREFRMIPVPIPPGCHLVLICDPYPAPGQTP